MGNRIKSLSVLLLLLSLSAVAWVSLTMKEQSANELYEDVTFMRIATEVRRYVSTIEYGVKNGRQLDNFYNMQDTLKGIQSCSSYMEGAYVISADGRLLYQRGLSAGNLRLSVPAMQNTMLRQLYDRTGDDLHDYLALPVRNGAGQIEGHVVLCIAKGAVRNGVMEFDRQSLIQTVVILLEVFGLGLFLISRRKVNRQGHIAFGLVLLVSFFVTFAAALDTGVVMVRFHQFTEDAVRQSANKMAQALQSEVDAVVAKGVSAERIHDLNGWLAQNGSELTVVTSLTLDRNRRVTANPSEAYINSFMNRFLFRTLLLISVCVAAGVLACVAAAWGERWKRRSARFARSDRLKGVTHA